MEFSYSYPYSNAFDEGACSWKAGNLCDKNIERQTVHTIVSWHVWYDTICMNIVIQLFFYYSLLFILNQFIIGQPVLLPAGCMMTQNMCFQDPNSI